MTTRLSWTRLVILTEDWPPLSAKDLMIVQGWNQYSRYAMSYSKGGFNMVLAL